MSLPRIVESAEWRAARRELLIKEKAATRMLDALAAERRRMPIVRFGAEYSFAGPDGAASLRDLFDGRRQLVLYQMMDNGPDDYCSGCAMFTDSITQLRHLAARDVTVVVVSDMPLQQLSGYWKRMGWTVPYYSSRGSTFSTDCGAGDGFGLSVFLADGEDVYRSYFTTDRGVDRLQFVFNTLDLVPYGRQESWEDSPDGWPQSPPFGWWRLHDEYDLAESANPSDRPACH